ncbi:MAG: hypothetical protein N2Z61_02620 [Tepidimonas fonticaldi]|nr:hypothetical protein [Tepidimonas fonticaldi]
MKKLAIAAAAAAAMTAGVAHAYTMGTFQNGFVVPNVIHNGSTQSTAVGIIANREVAVHWTFFDQNSEHVTDKCMEFTANDYNPFVWLNQSGAGLANKRGYLVFVAMADASNGTTLTTKCTGPKYVASTTVQVISGHAFEYDLAAKDVAYIPVIDGPLTITSGVLANQLGPRDLTAVGGAMTANGTNSLYMRYYIDGAAGGDDTRIVVWSTGDHKGSKTVDMYDDKQDPKSVNFVLSNTELDFVDPETIVGRPDTHKDGFIVWTPRLRGEGTNSTTTTTGSVFSYSVISAPAFGAVQTILNPGTN